MDTQQINQHKSVFYQISHIINSVNKRGSIEVWYARDLQFFLDIFFGRILLLLFIRQWIDVKVFSK